MTVDTVRLIAAAKEIEKKVLARKASSEVLARLAKKAKTEGQLTQAERAELEQARQPSVVNLEDDINELIGALHSKPATWK